MAKHTRAAMATPADLPKLVSYAEIEDWYDIDKRTIQRRMREGKWPRPMEGSGKNFWYLDDVLAALDGMRRGLVAAAVTDPNKLPADKVEGATLELAARLTGIPKERLVVSIGESRAPDFDDAMNAVIEAAWPLVRGGAALSERRAIITAYALFPSLRPILTSVLEANGVGDAVKKLASVEEGSLLLDAVWTLASATLDKK